MFAQTVAVAVQDPAAAQGLGCSRGQVGAILWGARSRPCRGCRIEDSRQETRGQGRMMPGETEKGAGPAETPPECLSLCVFTCMETSTGKEAATPSL